MELIDAIKNRISIRQFQDKEIPERIIIEMLESARLAPSGGNGQTHCFGIIKDLEIKN